MNKRSLSPHSIKKSICGIAGILICVLFCFLPVPITLETAASSVGSTGVTAMRVLGITLMAIFWWIGEIASDWVISLIMILLWILLGRFPFAEAFSAFSGTSIWLIVGAFFLAVANTKTGFFNRISWFLIRLFSPTFRGQVLAMLVTGTVCAPLVPSATAKAVLGATIAKNLADTMGYAPDSRGRCGFFVASFIGFSGITSAFMSGSVFTLTLRGALPEDILQEITWTSWLLAAIPWLLISLVGSFLLIQLLFCPKETSALTSEYIQNEYAKLGKMGQEERLSAILLIAAVLLWILEDFFHINAAVTALSMGCLCFCTGLLEPKELSTAVPWGLVVFLGGVLNLGTIFSKAGLNIWLQDLLVPVFSSLSAPLTIVLVVAAMTILLRMILVSQAATIIIMMAVLTPIARSANLSPFVIGFVILAMEQCWFLSFQNTTYAAALPCMQGTLSHHRTIFASICFEVVSLIGCLISIPFWRFLGLIG